jgi:hypothetical protein
MNHEWICFIQHHCQMQTGITSGCRFVLKSPGRRFRAALASLNLMHSAGADFDRPARLSNCTFAWAAPKHYGFKFAGFAPSILCVWFLISQGVPVETRRPFHLRHTLFHSNASPAWLKNPPLCSRVSAQTSLKKGLKVVSWIPRSRLRFLFTLSMGAVV